MMDEFTAKEAERDKLRRIHDHMNEMMALIPEDKPLLPYSKKLKMKLWDAYFDATHEMFIELAKKNKAVNG